MLQACYPAHLFATTFRQLTITCIPAPGGSPTLPGAPAMTMRLNVLFPFPQRVRPREGQPCEA